MPRQHRRHLLAGFPWRFSLTAAVVVAGLALLRATPLGPAMGTWLRLASELMIVYAALQVLRWLLLELPAQLGLWRGPSKILQDLLLLLIGASVTVVLVQQRGQVNLVGLVTTSAVLTAVVGLAAQETLKDLFAGITLQLDPPFREGDWIDLGDVRGTVQQLTLMNTQLESMDGSQIVLSNSTVAQATLKRFRPGGPIGLRFNLGLDYTLPPSEALRLLRQTLAQHPQVLVDPAPEAWVGAYGDSAITYEVMAFHTALGDRATYSLRSDLLEQIWYALERIGQSVPFPVREIRRRRERADTSLDFSVAGTQQRTELLAQNTLLNQLKPEELQQLAPLTRCLRFARGELIVREGDPGDALFQVVEGSVEVLKQTAAGSTTVVTTLTVGDVFGEMTLCTNEPRSATVQALEQTVLLEVERQDLLPLIEADPALLERIASLVARRRSELESLTQADGNAVAASLLSRMQQLFASMRLQSG